MKWLVSNTRASSVSKKHKLNCERSRGELGRFVGGAIEAENAQFFWLCCTCTSVLVPHKVHILLN
jgi:hypothetical protein